MSIELTLEATRPVHLIPLLPKIAAVLADILTLDRAPELLLRVFENGVADVVQYDELRVDGEPMFLILIAGEPEVAAVMMVKRTAVITMAAQRTPLEYALGAAVAIQLSRVFGVPIVDSWRFFGTGLELSADDLMQRLRLNSRNVDLRSASEQLANRLDRV